jgi:perosamine synthetase
VELLLNNLEILSMLISCDENLLSALEVIEKNSHGICFVVDELKLVGLLTDGDIRRALINGSDVKDSVTSVMQKNYVFLKVGASLKEIQSLLSDDIKYIPIINLSGEIVDYASYAKYHQIPLVKPKFNGNELEYVTECISTGWISSQGKFVSKFENSFAGYINAKYAVAVSNGTVGLDLALMALGVGPGDEVIVPDLTFAATINAVLHVGATPVIVDVDPVSLCINIADCYEFASDRLKAIIPVHLYGDSADISKLLNFCREKNVFLIEDCAEAVGTRYNNECLGSFGDASVFSFFGNKTMTTGEGGMVLFKNEDVANRAKILRDHGMSPNRRYWHDMVGYNYRLTNIQAAIGVAQLERLDEFILGKRSNANLYNEILKTFEEIHLPVERSDVFHTYWLYTILLPKRLNGHRDRIIQKLIEAGIEARPIFYPLHQMPIYSKYKKVGQGFTYSTDASSRGISLPSYPHMTEYEILKVTRALLTAINNSNESV